MVKSEHGDTNLILFEKNEWLTKLRMAFDALPKDFTGRASRGNVLDLLRDTKKSIVEFLAGMHDPMNEYVMGYLDRVICFAEVNAWPMISFDEFKVFLDVPEGMVKEVGKEEEKMSEEKEKDAEEEKT